MDCVLHSCAYCSCLTRIYSRVMEQNNPSTHMHACTWHCQVQKVTSLAIQRKMPEGKHSYPDLTHEVG